MRSRETSSRIALSLVAALLAGGCVNRDGANLVGDFPDPLLPEAEKPPERPKPKVFDNNIRVGDSLEVFVEEDPSFDGIYSVRERGDIIITQVGRIPVAGMSVSAAAAKIEAALERDQLTEATLIVDRVKRAPEKAPESTPADPRKNGRKIMVYMTGQVNRPGQHILTIPKERPMGVYEAILVSGGMGRFGNEQKVHILRMGEDGKRHRIPINIRLIEEGKVADPPIGHGDVVVVPEKVFGY